MRANLCAIVSGSSPSDSSSPSEYTFVLGIILLLLANLLISKTLSLFDFEAESHGDKNYILDPSPVPMCESKRSLTSSND